MQTYTAENFYRLSFQYINHTTTKSTAVGLRRFKSFFGVSPEVCATVWEILQKDETSNPKHLLWCLLFLKQYGAEHERRAILNVDEKTIRKWTWEYVRRLGEIQVVKFADRFKNSLPGQSCFCSLDGVDFRINEPRPFSNKWFSHKFKGPGLRYEIGLNIKTGDIVWKFGGYPCGEYPDLKLANQSYLHSIIQGEKTIADRGYNNPIFFILPNENNSIRHNQIMSRHETINKRIRQFKILKDTYKHNLDYHPLIFHAVLNLTQLSLQCGEPLYSI